MSYEKEYLEIAGVSYTIDLVALADFVGLTVKSEEDEEEEVKYEKQIDVSRYEMSKFMLEIVFSSGDEIDDKMGITALNSLPTSYKLAFNTLLYHNILKEV
tara:strand:- start:677 stop:979 length:303 start_codon:yes stop_codon:yes gene_type:complete